MYKLYATLYKNDEEHNILHKSAISLTLLYCSLLASAGASAMDFNWYDNGDPLSTNLALPPAISAADLSASDASSPCEKLDFSQALSLMDVTEAALCNNPQTRESYANAKVQAAQLGIAKSAYLPTLNDNIGVNANVGFPKSARGRDYYNLNNNLVASYLLYDFGMRDANLENARQLLQAASATQSAIVQSLLLATIKAYYQVQTDIASLAATKEAENLNSESYKAAEAKYKVGVSTPADKLQAQTAYAQATLNRISAEGTLRSDYGVLANVMGLNANTPVKLIETKSAPDDTNELERDIAQLIEQASVRRPDLIASEAQVNAAKANVEASRAAAKPTVSIGVSNGYNNGTDLSYNNTSTLGLNVSIPIFAGYGPSYQIHSAEAAVQVKEAQRDQLRLQTSLDVWSAFQNLRTANESLKSAKVLVDSAQESARFALGRYKAGVGNIIDTLTAQNALASANQQKIKADLNWSTARASLAQSIGSLDNLLIQSLPDGSKDFEKSTP
jgi:outer membrane protein